MHPNCSGCRRPHRDCTCRVGRFYDLPSDDKLLHIGGSWSPAQHVAKEADGLDFFPCE